jgi:hypothetical protein
MNEKQSMALFYKLMAMLVILLFLTFKAYGDDPQLPQTYIAGWFPKTWTCPNHSCGYDNYDGIDYCSLCGTRRR